MRLILLISSALLATAAAQADTDVKVDMDADADDIVLRSEQGSMPAADVEKLLLTSDIGEVRITASDADTVSWQLEILVNDKRNDSPSRKQQDLAAAAEITAEQDDDQVRLKAVWSKSLDLDEEISERWTVTVPTRLAAKVDMDIGTLEITGLAGGIEADMGIGELIIAIPHGSVRADLGIGDLKITSATRDLGEVDLDVDIGEVRFDGYSAAPQPGYDFPIGQELHFDADGEDDIQVNSNIGNVAVEITAIK